MPIRRMPGCSQTKDISSYIYFRHFRLIPDIFLSHIHFGISIQRQVINVLQFQQ